MTRPKEPNMTLPPEVLVELDSSLPPIALHETWRSPEEAPITATGTDVYCIVAVRRAHSGKVCSFPALYLNAKELEFPDEDEERAVTGWYDYNADEGDGGTYYEVLRSGDELVAWCAVPQYAPTPQQASMGGSELKTSDTARSTEAMRAENERLKQEAITNERDVRLCAEGLTAKLKAAREALEKIRRVAANATIRPNHVAQCLVDADNIAQQALSTITPTGDEDV